MGEGDSGGEGVAFASRHGFDGKVCVSIVDEKGIDKVGGGDNVFADHVSHGDGFTVTAGSCSLNLCVI